MKLKQLLCSTLLLLLVTGCSTPKSTASSTKPYPLKVCLVSGNKLGAMGDIITETYNGQEVKFCCEPCVKKFHAHPEKYLPKIAR
ncbi:MAG: YHS domain-containing protein [Verrucomicrobia bacterium]|nr:MAG: YHS domain-containing protein [Verrucomicrobiota bacterium]